MEIVDAHVAMGGRPNPAQPSLFSIKRELVLRVTGSSHPSR
jgi:hypothetical protein